MNGHSQPLLQRVLPHSTLPLPSIAVPLSLYLSMSSSSYSLLLRNSIVAIPSTAPSTVPARAQQRGGVREGQQSCEVRIRDSKFRV
jgi:hypothetical protein